MSEATAETRSLVEELQTAVEDPRWDFRTVEGISRDLGLPANEVADILAQHPEVVRSSAMTDQNGNELYTASHRAPTMRERLERIRWILAH